jgi:6-phosphogluconolactonase (cycloisomerase 2 family)
MDAQVTGRKIASPARGRSAGAGNHNSWSGKIPLGRWLLLGCAALGGIIAGCGGGGGSPKPTVTLALNSTSIALGTSATLTWSSTNATSCTASGAWSGTQTTSGTQSETPTAAGTDTYTLTCTGNGGSGSASATLTVNAPAAPTVTISVSPSPIIVGSSATLTWSSTNATSCTASGAWSGTQAISGTQSVTPSATGTDTYSLNCTGAGGSGSGSASLTVNPAPAPTVSISFDPTSITLGASSTLTWSSTNSTSCTGSGSWSGSESTNGSESVTPSATGSDTYTLDCTGAGGSTSESAMLTVNPPSAAAYIYTLDGDGTLTEFSEAQSGGDLYLLATSPLNPNLTDTNSMVLDQTLNLMFVSSYQGTGSIYALTVSPSTGTLALTTNSVTTTDVPTTLAIGPSGTVLYAASYGSATIAAYTITPSSGALTPVAGSPYPVTCSGAFCGNDNNPGPMLYDSADQTLYLADVTDWVVGAYSVGANGSLTFIANTSADINVNGLAITPNGKFLYATNAGAGDVSAYAITPTATLSGNPEPLTPVTSSPFAAGSNPATPVIEPTGHYLYVYNSGAQSVEAYSINQTSGELTLINTYSIDNPDMTGLTGEGGLAIDPSGNYLYVANPVGMGNISVFSISATDGTLTQLPTSPYPMGAGVGLGPNWISVYNPN